MLRLMLRMSNTKCCLLGYSFHLLIIFHIISILHITAWRIKRVLINATVSALLLVSPIFSPNARAQYLHILFIIYSYILIDAEIHTFLRARAPSMDRGDRGSIPLPFRYRFAIGALLPSFFIFSEKSILVVIFV
jgi:hypothetical protein